MNESGIIIESDTLIQLCNKTLTNCLLEYAQNSSEPTERPVNTVIRETIEYIINVPLGILIKAGIDESVARTAITVRYYLVGWMLLVVGIAGLIGNLLCGIVLSRPSIRSKPVNILQLILTVFDFVKIGTSFFGVTFYQFVDPSSDHPFFTYWHPVFAGYVLGLWYISHIGSILFTLLLTVERYIAICMPIKSRSLLSRGRTLKAAGIATVYSIIYSLPYFFIYKTKVHEISDPLTEQTLKLYIKEQTSVPANILFRIFYGKEVNLISQYIIPLIIMSFCNLKICMALRKFHRTRKELTSVEVEKISLTKPVICIITLSIVTCCFYLIVVVTRLMASTPFVIFVKFYGTFIFFFTLVLNSSVNFIFYCLYGTQFRAELVTLFSFKCLRSTTSVSSVGGLSNQTKRSNDQTA